MEKIYKYIEDHASVPSEALAWVEKQTHIRTNHARMLSGSVQGQIMRMMVQMCGASSMFFNVLVNLFHDYMYMSCDNLFLSKSVCAISRTSSAVMASTRSLVFLSPVIVP